MQQLDGCESAIGFEGAFESETHVYIVMEVVDNDDLSDIFRVRCHTQLPWPHYELKGPIAWKPHTASTRGRGRVRVRQLPSALSTE